MSAQTLLLPAVIDPASVGAVKAELAAARGVDVTVDASAVQRIGGLGLQVLLAAARAWSADNLAFRLADPSPAFTEMLRLTGAADLAEFA